ncbi:hypothetical protein ACFVYV_37820, partial [Streptomyces mirabilis]|uniref:hypothetical protein n=1 Tax=Streptomyces mirabilis TaxID=68239 RepID=UPI0036DC22EB
PHTERGNRVNNSTHGVKSHRPQRGPGSETADNLPLSSSWFSQLTECVISPITRPGHHATASKGFVVLPPLEERTIGCCMKARRDAHDAGTRL